MNRNWLFVGILSFSIIFSPLYISKVEAHSHPQTEERHMHFHISDQEFNNLIKKGYSRQEIFRAHFISKHSTEKNLEKILSVYKKNQSWEETAKHFGVDLEKIKQDHIKKHKQFYERNKTKIIQYLTTYTGKSATELENFLKDDVDLHFLVVAAAISKKSNTDISQIIQYKKEGKNYKDIITMLKLEPNTVFMEAKKIHKDIYKIVQE
ncbi:hypothetical protein ACQKP0_05450 [Heyndrickxia sp. NPDC080065]|uniref:hypothetical protein n=1 Tax=Heyndrickxia sp. NPDC080065 TaxID=3390568 RepID=UPI003CFFDF92